MRSGRILAGCLLAALVPAGCARDGSSYEGCRDCNLVVISVDTLRADHVGALGYAKATTPNIDGLAARGVLFENAIAQSSWTRPAHMSIFTGLHPREHGFVALADSRRLEDSIPTLASVLRGHGYTTAAFVGGVNMSASFGFDQGFDVYRSNGKYFRDNLEDARYWLDLNADRRFFLFFHGYDAHTPYRNDPIDRQSLALPARPPETGLGTTCRAEGPVSRVDPYIAEYDGSVHRADRYVGKMVAELEARRLLDHTVLIVLSDHGEEFLEHGRCFHIATLYREVLQVPVLIVAPGLAPRRVPHLVSASVTIAPTAMELLGLDDHPFPAMSLVAAAMGGAAPAEPVVSETERNAERKGDGRVIALTEASERLFHWSTPDRLLLFDWTSDPREEHGMADSPHLSILAARLEAWTASHPARSPSRRRTPADKQAPAASSSNGDSGVPDDREDLRSLGYLE